MTLSVVLSTFNEERDIDRALDAIFHQTALPDEVIVVEGGSTDGTLARLQERARKEPTLTVISDRIHRSLPEALNLAIQRSTSTFVAKVDARTFIDRDFFSRALTIFGEERSDLACVGGQPEQFGETRFGEGFARARGSRFGVGASGYADPRPRVEVDSVQCGVYRRKALDAVGFFDPTLQFGEDEELNWRLRCAGYRIIRDAGIRLRYVTRPSWKAAFRQYRNYGRARVRVWKKHPAFLRPHHAAPAIAVLAGGTLCAAAAFSTVARSLLFAAGALYAACALYAALRASADRPMLAPYAAAAFPALHLGYGIGLIEGLCIRRR